MPTVQIESLLSARLFLSPQVAGERFYFFSNLSGRLSLYAMDLSGSVPEPLLPPQIALQNPDLIGGQSYAVFPGLGKIVVMIDQDGDENYQPMLIPIDGGIPEPAFGDCFAGQRVHLIDYDLQTADCYLHGESRTEAMQRAYRANLVSGEVICLAESPWGAFVGAFSDDHTKVLIGDGYTAGDAVAYLWTRDEGTRLLLYGTPLEARAEGQKVPLTGFGSWAFVQGDHGVLAISSLFSDSYGLAYLPLDRPRTIDQVAITGEVHMGVGELTFLEHLDDDRYLVGYNIDGCSWLYQGRFDQAGLQMRLGAVICGQGILRDGVLEAVYHDSTSDRLALSFSTATSPTQLYTVGPDRDRFLQYTRERILGVPDAWLSPGEDASFTSHDGLRISARLYLPASALGHTAPYPLVYYIHGGPQSQERPNFAWFSMPLIQFLTINGFAVFVPNVRGSTGYGQEYMKRVDHDWGGQDRLDHVHAMGLLRRDRRIDAGRAGVIGRSYGGYMTLTMASRHPDLWSAAVDMFGPYDLLGFMDRIPATWKPYFALAVGDPEKDREFLIERSPRTHIEAIRCPLLVIQGKNDPRVTEPESREVVERLRSLGKSVDYLMFEDEGHDVLKFENRVACYNAITAFFARHLRA
jgi:pimeloyl-ACP methyl ester carboxylesterase